MYCTLQAWGQMTEDGSALLLPCVIKDWTTVYEMTGRNEKAKKAVKV